MAFSIVSTLLVLCLAAAACGRPPDPASSRVGEPEGDRAGSATDAVAAARIQECAGVTAERAAQLLDVAATSLDVQAGPSEFEGDQLCRYWSAESLIGPGFQFVLDVEDSPAAAARALARLRENAPAGDAAIRKPSDTQPTAPPLIEIEGIGDEAFWEALTNAVNVRVKNVLVSIQASQSRSAVEHDERTAIALERRIAEEVVRGLR